MLVYVATPKQIDLAFCQWIDETDDDERRILYQVYQWFMSSDCAKEFNTVTGLTCFSLNSWVSTFRQWIDREIDSHPDHAVNIRKWAGILTSLLSSNWGIQRKLIVRECLDANDKLNM